MKKTIRHLFNRRPHLRAAALLLLVLLPVAFADEKPNVAPEKARAWLQAGNRKFVKGNRRNVNYLKERAALVAGQHPYAVLLTCSDSRVPPELVFDESLGKLFIIRVAGNVTDSVALGSIEYAVDHFGVRLLVVLGHASCGAVKATFNGDKEQHHVGTIAGKIKPAVDRAKAAQREHGLDDETAIRLAIEENVRDQIKNVRNDSEFLRGRIDKQLLTVDGAVYELKSGKVKWLASEK
ncbi:MAG TPA: carbonic anhydrase [Blastocatellia bacterium]|nr:carbonic anhydrase [Blastocatellia bacterium]